MIRFIICIGDEEFIHRSIAVGVELISARGYSLGES